MNKIPVKQITSWSFSRYNTYVQCPLKLKLNAIDRIKEPGNEAMARGDMIHKMAEAYIKGKGRVIPKELKLFVDEFKRLRAQYKKKINGMVVEDTWAFRRDWTETTWDDWTGCFLRIKLDCAHHEDDETMVISDWKTGKFRPEMNEDYIEQLELYALGAMVRYPHIKTVKPRLVYLDLGLIYPPAEQPIIYTRDDIVKLKKNWEKRIKPMINDKIFAPRANDKCRWCFYRASNKAAGGGQCKF